jgi:dipeptidyl aminopeptidase/acylaminoacyl peptidase
MRAKLLLSIGLVAIVAVSWVNQPGVTAQAQDIKAAYDRSASLGQRTNNLVYNQINGTPTFIDGGKLWYQKTVKGGTEFVLVDPVAKTKAPAFDHAKLAGAINTVANGKFTAVTLPFSTFTYVDNMQAIQFAVTPGGGGGGRAGGGGGGGRAGAGPPAAAGAQYRCTLTTYVCTQQTPPQGGGQGAGRQGGGRQGGGGGGRAGGAPGAAAEEQVRNQPNGGCWQALIQNYNIYLRPFTGQGAPAGCSGQKAQPFMLSTDGSEGNAYRFQSMTWSPDGRKIAAFRRRPGYDRQVHYIESRPADQLQPKHTSIFYRKPGDVMDFDYPVVFDVASKRMMQGDVSLFPNPYTMTNLAWWADSRAVTFEYNQRGHEIYRVLELDATTGKTRTLIEEAPKTFVEYSSGKRFRRNINDGREIIWMSERDGWNHLYLIDGTTGTVKNQITKGQWIVRNDGVVRVDEQNRQIWFNASGMHAGKDPYFVHHYRVNFDGTGLTAFTSEDGTHQGFGAVTPQLPPGQQEQQQQPPPTGPAPFPRGTNFSPDGQYYVDTWSRVDLPFVSVLKRTSDQSVVMELEKGDASALLAAGWKMPEVFVSKARDGVTDIWGIIIRPTNFDPARKYPVIENIYAGPQGSFVPKAWSTQGGMMGLAELGFIVVQVDGMGTSNRSKAFHDVAWKNLGDAGFPDRIIWHKAIAAKYSWYDITRVGIYGTSAGGQNATGGMLFHPDFYKVAVSNSGCHDNRMDKIWWNEQWMGWPLGPHYGASSNVDNAKNLKGKMQLVVPEMDSNVDPTSTLQVVAELVRNNKEFELVFIPGANHGAGSPITQRKRNDFFVKHLLGIDPPDWNNLPPPNAGAGDFLSDEPDYFELERAPFFPDGGK